MKERLPRRSRRFGVGKDIGGALYIHRSYADVLPPGILTQAMRLLPRGFPFDVVKWNHRTGAVTFVSCPEFDEVPEPRVGESILVRPNGTIRRRKAPTDPEVYHHKWLFVTEDYEGFDVGASKERSARTLALPGLDPRRIGRLSYWRAHALPYLDD